MFAKKLFSNKSSFINQPQRSFQTFGKTYMTGFDRMLLDKLSYFRVNGYWFALFGIGNILAFGAHLIMPKDWYRYHFAYTAYPARLFKPLKSQLGSENLVNVAWTAPALIGLNWYLHAKVGSLVMTKFFFLSLFASFIFMSAANPQSGLNVRLINKFVPKYDSYADDGSYYMGADQMAASICYFTLLYHRYWLLTLSFIAFDAFYYGPSFLGAGTSAIAGALMFL